MLDTWREIALRKMMTSGRKCAILFAHGNLWAEVKALIH